MKAIFRSLVLAAVCGSVLSSLQNLAADELAAILRLIKSGNLTEASGRIAAALEVHPGEPAFHSFQGVVAAQQCRYEAAEAAFLHAIALAPRFTGAYLNLGRLYQENIAMDPCGDFARRDLCLVVEKITRAALSKTPQKLRMSRRTKNIDGNALPGLTANLLRD